MARSPLPHTVYAITNDRGDLYVGATADMRKRLAAHNAGTAHWFTAKHGPWRIAHTQPATSKAEARCFERAWSNALHDTGTLPFLTSAVQNYEPKTHRDHGWNSARNLALRQWRSAAYEDRIYECRKHTRHGWDDISPDELRDILRSNATEAIRKTAQRMRIHDELIALIRNGSLLRFVLPDEPRTPEGTAYRKRRDGTRVAIHISNPHGYRSDNARHAKEPRLYDYLYVLAWTIRTELPRIRLREYLTYNNPGMGYGGFRRQFALYDAGKLVVLRDTLDEAEAAICDYLDWKHPANRASDLIRAGNRLATFSNQRHSSGNAAASMQSVHSAE